MITFTIGVLLAVYGFRDVHAHVDSGARTKVAGLKFGTSERRRSASSEDLILNLTTGVEVVLPLTTTKDLGDDGFCGSSHVGAMDVVVTGCEGEDRSITIGGEGSWEYTVATGSFRRIADVDDDTCTTMDPPEDDQDAMAMNMVVTELASEGLTLDVSSSLNAHSEFDMEVRYYYDESLLAKYDGDHNDAKNAIREMHAHAEVMMRHESIGRKVHLLFNVDPVFVDLSLHAGPSNALPNFMTWLQNKGLCDRSIAFHHIITDRRSDGVSGVAWLGTVCHDNCYNTGITEVYFTPVSAAHTLAHEFGHNLGALHTFSSANQGRNCHGIMSYGSRPKTWSECSKERWLADYEIFVQATSQSRADQCFRPRNGGSPVSSPTPNPTKSPTRNPTPAPVSGGCVCSGQINKYGSGGPSCSSGWCYTAVGACPDGRTSSILSGQEWSYDACDGGSMPAPTPNPVPAPTPNPVPAPTPNPVPSPTPMPVSGGSGSCKCSGRVNSRGQGGADCSVTSWCYTAIGACDDGRSSSSFNDQEWSFDACRATPVSPPTKLPTPNPVSPPTKLPTPTPVSPPTKIPSPNPVPSPTPIPGPSPSPSGYKAMPGSGWCMTADNKDDAARYTMPWPTTHAKTKAACDADSQCVAYVWGENKRVGMIYSTNGCKADCSNTSWQSNPSLITKSEWDGQRTYWADCTCNVKD